MEDVVLTEPPSPRSDPDRDPEDPAEARRRTYPATGASTGRAAGEAAAIWLALWIVLYRLAAGPMSWDELWYLSLSVDPQPDPAILNRYFHIYLQMPFLRLMGDAIAGARLFWSFLIAGTAGLVYFNSRTLAREAGWGVGAVALLLFLAPFQILSFPGSTWADYTVMALTMAAMTVYVLSLDAERRGRLTAAFLLGALLLLAGKTKEVGAVTVGVFLGGVVLGWPRRGRSEAVREAAAVVAGLVSGTLLMVLLDAILVGDALFMFRSDNVRELLAFNDTAAVRRGQNWFAHFSDSSMLVPIVLYALGAARVRGRGLRFEKRVIWLVPLGLFSFLLFTNIVMGSRAQMRYFVSCIPVVAVLVATYFGDMFRPLPLRRPAAVAVGIGSAIAVGLTYELVLRPIASGPPWSLFQFNVHAIHVTACTVLFVVLLWTRNRTATLGALGLALLFGTLPSLLNHTRGMFNGDYRGLVEHRFYPLAVYAEELAEARDRSLLVSPNLYKQHRMLGRDQRSTVWMLTSYFNARYAPERVVFSASPDRLESVDLALLTQAEIREAQGASMIRDGDVIELDPGGRIGLVQLTASAPARAKTTPDPSLAAAQADRLLQQAFESVSRGQNARAEAIYRSALELRATGEGGAIAYNGLGWALYQQGRLEPALEAFDRALELNPSYERARNNRELVRRRLREAEAELESSPEPGPGDGP